MHVIAQSCFLRHSFRIVLKFHGTRYLQSGLYTDHHSYTTRANGIIVKYENKEKSYCKVTSPKIS